MSQETFLVHLSKIASRMRHDLKGGLLTLKMGLESLDDEEALKPLLLGKAEELVDLSDKLILLLRMGETKKCRVGLGGLAQHLTREVGLKYPKLAFECRVSEPERRVYLDPDALSYAVLELAQNSTLAGAGKISAALEAGTETVLSFQDDGSGEPETDPAKLREFGYSGWSRTGLGLSIIESFAAAHDGRLELASVDGRLTVSLIVPTMKEEGSDG